MSSLVNKEMCVVNKKWINFENNENDKEQNNQTDKEKIPQNEKTTQIATIESKTVNIQLPPPPTAPSRSSKKEVYLDKQSSRSSTPYLSNSSNESPSSSKLNITDNKQKSSSTETFAKNNLSTTGLQNISLKDVSSRNQPKFKNGDLLVNLLPLNTQCAWLTPAIFRPELVPEELMSSEFKLTVEDYVSAMQMLINDYRFNLYIVFYKKVTLIWLILGFFILFTILFSNAQGIILFFGMLFWLLMNAFGFFITYWIKTKMVRNLERCLARVNEQFVENNIILAVDDKGRLSCHKINLIFIYFDSTECIKKLNELFNKDSNLEAINNTINNLNQLNNNKYETTQQLNMLQTDVEIPDIIITGTTPTRLTQKDKYGLKLFLRYSQRWAKDFTRQRIGFETPLHYDASISSVSIQPRHCQKARCPCQYIEEHLSFKPNHHCGLRDILG